ncbi:tRNA (adenine(37)-N6)-methyltransferase [Pseudochaenichthys georgianus]|uniref:Uncharacterized protein n=1 Tax=Chaenocephalus aceratus TaxID=36190 RepID=A0ACB9XZC3_CHAAC|nr:tRNA (adenine(37)-N6)-methyltransferase [Pseudochaenichthys georgianus]KAI4832707.1 hypothetical protein KUCAC02_015661 [Chaenocephalus aceratus]
MSPRCDCCGEHVEKLNQQITVMRKEIKNLRQILDGAGRAHRKHMTSIRAAVANIGLREPDKEQAPPPPLAAPQALEQGNIQTVPIGYISSCFAVKNGTPRQPTICGPSRAELRIQQSIFNNPEHALVGLEQYSHVWIIFLFHKNGHLNYKAKVKPPRLNGQRVGVYSTRSPHRPNALGLTLARLDKIDGDTVHLSDIDMIAGTPVLDIKPYIPDYDSPHSRLDKEHCDPITDQKTDAQSDLESDKNDNEALVSLLSKDKPEAGIPVRDSSKSVSAQLPLHKNIHQMLDEVRADVTQGELQLSCASEDQVSHSPKTKAPECNVDYPCYGEKADITIAGWIREPPVSSLQVRFTPQAQKELADFLPTHLSGPSESDRPRFRFLRSTEEAVAAIRGVLSADPRSIHRRTRCRDRLFYFILDSADITCWFGQGFAEVLQVRPVEQNVVSV